MPSQGVPALSSVDVEDLCEVVHGGAGKEIASVMEIHIPHCLRVVLVGGNAGVIGNIPKLYI